MRPLADLSFALVGAGRVGESLSRWLVAQGGRLRAVGARASSRRAVALAAELGAESAEIVRLDSSGVDLLLLALPDGALAPIASGLATRPQAPIVLHTSGAHGTEVLAPLAATGSAVGSFHPLLAFPRVLPDAASARGAVFALDGAPRAVALGERLAAALGAVPITVPAAARPLYHLAASLAAGGTVTLLALADELRRRAGLPDEVRNGLFALAHRALAAAQEVDEPARAITGPAARGDRETVARHLAALAAAAPEEVPLVLALLASTLRRREAVGAPSAAEIALAKWLETADFLDRPGGGC